MSEKNVKTKSAGQKAVVGLHIAQAAVSKTKTVKKAPKAKAKPKAVHPVKPLSQAKERSIGVKKAVAVRKPRVKKEAPAVVKPAEKPQADQLKIIPPAKESITAPEVKGPAAAAEVVSVPQEKIVEIDIPVM